jgi:predicted metalloprotease
LEFDGIDNAGPDYVLAHEFAHHIQYTVGTFDTPKFPTEAEKTRYVELMADALAAYFLHHPRQGTNFQTWRIEQVVRAAFSAGDCGFDNPGHHGTPSQRAKAVRFATDLVDNSRKKGFILPATTFIEMFDAQYNTIIAPDANRY